MVTVFDVADYFLNRADKEEDGDIITNLKLQKLVYYAQGFHLAMFDKPLFDNQIEAWTHGPVCPDLYHAKKSFGRGPVEANVDFDGSIFSDDQLELLDEIYTVYGQFSAWRLRDLTHEESPWCNNKDSKNIISHSDLSEYFSTQLQ